MVSRVLVCGKNRTWPSIRSTSHPVPPAIYPQYKSGTPNCCMILLQMRFAYAVAVARDAVGSYPAFSPLPLRAVIFCSTFCQAKSYALRIAPKNNYLPLPGYYPASFPVEPGLYLTQETYHQDSARDHISSIITTISLRLRKQSQNRFLNLGHPFLV